MQSSSGFRASGVHTPLITQQLVYRALLQRSVTDRTAQKELRIARIELEAGVNGSPSA